MDLEENKSGVGAIPTYVIFMLLLSILTIIVFSMDKDKLRKTLARFQYLKFMGKSIPTRLQIDAIQAEMLLRESREKSFGEHLSGYQRIKIINYYDWIDKNRRLEKV